MALAFQTGRSGLPLQVVDGCGHILRTNRGQENHSMVTLTPSLGFPHELGFPHPGSVDLPDSATSAIGTPCSYAMKPRTEKMAKPATKLVPLFRQQSIIQSLLGKGEVAGSV